MIDWERVRELRSEIGADDFAEVVEMFLSEADEAVTSENLSRRNLILWYEAGEHTSG